MIHSIKGVKDILPDEMVRWHHVEQLARHWAEVSGFSEIRVPIFEVTELFARSIGASTDIVEKEMYTFPDRDGKLLTLRPEATAGVVRAYIEHNLGAAGVPRKMYYLGPMFRHERPQAGRLRQFHQFGLESFGMASPLADVDVLAVLWRFLSGLALPGLTLEINSLGDLNDRATYKDILQTFLRPLEADLCENCRRRFTTNPLRVLDCKVPTCREVTTSAPPITDHLSSASRAHFDGVIEGLTALQIPFLLNPRLVRGLDYYTLTTFEVTCSHLGAQNAVGAGGRYDGLVSVLGGSPTPAVGFAVGLERIALMLPETTVPVEPPLVFVAGFGAQGQQQGFLILHALRAVGIRADTDYRANTLKNLMKQADRFRAKSVIILGDDEVLKNMAVVRDMETKAQIEIPLSSLVSHFQTSAFSS